jgi:hypothetical protein
LADKRIGLQQLLLRAQASHVRLHGLALFEGAELRHLRDKLRVFADSGDPASHLRNEQLEKTFRFEFEWEAVCSRNPAGGADNRRNCHNVD